MHKFRAHDIHLMGVRTHDLLLQNADSSLSTTSGFCVQWQCGNIGIIVVRNTYVHRYVKLYMATELIYASRNLESVFVRRRDHSVHLNRGAWGVTPISGKIFSDRLQVWNCYHIINSEKSWKSWTIPNNTYLHRTIFILRIPIPAQWAIVSCGCHCALCVPTLFWTPKVLP
jgi:hypothetical protein